MLVDHFFQPECFVVLGERLAKPKILLLAVLRAGVSGYHNAAGIVNKGALHEG